MEYYKRHVTLSIHRISNKFFRKIVKWSSHVRLFVKSNRLLLADVAFLSLQLHVDERLAQNSMCMRSLFVIFSFFRSLSLCYSSSIIYSHYFCGLAALFISITPHIYISMQYTMVALVQHARDTFWFPVNGVNATRIGPQMLYERTEQYISSIRTA